MPDLHVACELQNNRHRLSGSFAGQKDIAKC